MLHLHLISKHCHRIITPVIPVAKLAALRDRQEDQHTEHRTHLLTMQRMDFFLFVVSGL
jgi:hypothetical protein